MTNKHTFHPKPRRIEIAHSLKTPSKAAPRRGGFDPAFLGTKGPSGPRGPKGRTPPLPSKSRGRG